MRKIEVRFELVKQQNKIVDIFKAEFDNILSTLWGDKYFIEYETNTERWYFKVGKKFTEEDEKNIQILNEGKSTWSHRKAKEVIDSFIPRIFNLVETEERSNCSILVDVENTCISVRYAISLKTDFIIY
jgi:hypothetical protein